MRHIGSIAQAKSAENFAAYLTVQGIANHVELDGEQHDIWVKEEDRLDEATHHYHLYLKDPEHERYSGSIDQAQTLIQEKIDERQKAQKNIVNVRERWPRGRRRKAPLAITLIVISCIVALLSSFGRVTDDQGNLLPTNRISSAFKALVFNHLEGEPARRVLANKTSDDDLRFRLAAVMRGQFWRALTPIFIHFGVIHLLFNMIWMFQLGRLLEDRFGTVFFAMIVLLTAVIPNVLGEVVPEAIDGHVPAYTSAEAATPVILSLAGGMSGVIYGLFGFAWIRSVIDPMAGFMMPQSTVIILIGWMFLGFTGLDQRFFGLNMGNWAHGGGLVIGMLIAYLSVQVMRSKSKNRSGKT